MAFVRLNGPIGPERADWHTAHIVCTLANIFRTGKQAYKLQDFLLKWAPRWRRQDPKEAELLLMGWLRQAEKAAERKERRRGDNR